MSTFEELLARALGRDESASAEMYGRFKKLAYVVGRKYFFNLDYLREWCHDAAVYVMMLLIQNRRTDIANVKVFFYVTIRMYASNCLQYLRQECRNPDFEIPIDLLTSEPATHPRMERSIYLKQTVDAILDGCTEPERVLLNDAYWMEYRAQDWVLHRGTSPITASNRLKKLRLRIKKRHPELSGAVLEG